MNRLFLTGLFGFLYSVSVSLQATEHRTLIDWHNPDYIEKAFVEIAFKNEYSTRQTALAKWQSPIYYTFNYHHVDKNPIAEELFKAHLTQLQSITGLKIKEAGTASQANFTIVLTQDRLYKQDIFNYTHTEIKDLERDTHCLGHYRKGSNGAIVQAVVILPIDHAMSRGMLPACVVEETTQTLGLPNDSDWVNPSIANDSSKLDLLTGLDYIFLKVLYSDKLHAGMSLSHSRPLIKQEIRKLQKDGTIKRASKLVNQEGLYPLLY
ncbi:DUF2927 domain-containing protein [Thiomicrorhabdus sp. ZW0627]|uniref:DUF2927 domain-containing protein n=1 Tax=Thiomicrorhabdus sp. ZW0627 TaxID=3039774 RepID=UPI002436F8BD|nr:DUF2927 domain-containing protein [Thiomicrorhabdus sp. ZW0627]MDG6774841.1 DUF2927 domain-containing protein [Thiomicrorhabdus sp. ZW0627]